MNDQNFDQVLMFLILFTIAVVTANCYLLFTLNKRARQWITLTTDLITMLTKAETEATQFRAESRAAAKPKAPPRKRSPKKHPSMAEITAQAVLKAEKPTDTP